MSSTYRSKALIWCLSLTLLLGVSLYVVVCIAHPVINYLIVSFILADWGRERADLFLQSFSRDFVVSVRIGFRFSLVLKVLLKYRDYYYYYYY